VSGSVFGEAAFKLIPRKIAKEHLLKRRRNFSSLFFSELIFDKYLCTPSGKCQNIIRLAEHAREEYFRTLTIVLNKNFLKKKIICCKREKRENEQHFTPAKEKFETA